MKKGGPKISPAIVDTNVAYTADSTEHEAPPGCVEKCAQVLEDLMDHDKIVLDTSWDILREYMDAMETLPSQHLGHEFLKWVLSHQGNPKRCVMETITPVNGPQKYEEFPDNEDLLGFDNSDKKFVALSNALDDDHPILNAVDTDWLEYRSELQEEGIEVQNLCESYLESKADPD